MNAIPLTGLVGSHPLGALAAFGLLRCCQELDGFRGARLSWKKEDDWFAELSLPVPKGPEELVAALSSRQTARPTALELNWSNTLKTTKEIYCEAASNAQEAIEDGCRDYADYLVAFANELLVNESGQLEPTAFYMTSGRQEFLKEARNLAASLAKGITVNRKKKTTQEMFAEALFGPWKYEDPQHSLGWDPGTERLHALRAKSPTKESSSGVTAAVWLAFEALPLFPCFISGGILVTTGFHTDGTSRSKYLTWPVWTPPVSLGTVRSLLSREELSNPKLDMTKLRACGIEGVFRSQRYRVKTQGSYYILRPTFQCT